MDCTGKRIAFTGSVDGVSRSQIHNAIVAAGGTLVASVSRNTDLLLYGERGVTGSKHRNADEYGIPKLNALAFMTDRSTSWPYPPRQKRSESKKAKPNKALVRSFKQLAKQAEQSGFVGV